MSVTVTKEHNPPLQMLAKGWKWFQVCPDGRLAHFEIHFIPSVGPVLEVGKTLESAHGFCIFLDRKEAEKWPSKYNPLRKMGILCEIWAMGIFAEGTLGTTGLRCAKAHAIFIGEHTPESSHQALSEIATAERAVQL